MTLIKIVSRLLRLTVSLSLILMLAACATGKVIKTYEGETLALGQEAILTAPENIALLSVNGRSVQQYLLSDLSVKYALKAGVNVVVFQYESVWGKAKTVSDGRRSEKVESAPREALISAKPGDQYTFSFLKPGNVREARALANDFKANVFNQNSVLVAEAVALNTYSSEGQESAPVDGVTAVAVKDNISATEAQDENISVVDSLKSMWGTASAEEKKAFLVWAFQ